MLRLQSTNRAPPLPRMPSSPLADSAAELATGPAAPPPRRPTASRHPAPPRAPNALARPGPRLQPPQAPHTSPSQGDTARHTPACRPAASPPVLLGPASGDQRWRRTQLRRPIAASSVSAGPAAASGSPPSPAHAAAAAASPRRRSSRPSPATSEAARRAGSLRHQHAEVGIRSRAVSTGEASTRSATDYVPARGVLDPQVREDHICERRRRGPQPEQRVQRARPLKGRVHLERDGQVR